MKRYTISAGDPNDSYKKNYWEFGDPDGEWVKHEDAKEVEAENTRLKELNRELLRVAQNRISALEELAWLYKGFLPNFYKGRESKLWIRIHANEQNSKEDWEKVLSEEG